MSTIPRTPASRLASLRRAVSPLAMIVALSVVLAVVIAVSSVASLVRTLTTRIDTAAAEQNEQKQLDAFNERLKRYTAQVNGRSLFVTPRAVATADAPPPPVSEDREPVKPTRYGGPSVIAMINGAAWFSNGKRVAVGEEADGVRVLSLNAPWSVHVVWEGVEFDVGLFDRDSVVYRSGSNATPRGYVAPTGPLSSGSSSGSTASPAARPSAASPASTATNSAAAPGSVPPPQTLVPGALLLPPPPVEGGPSPTPAGTDPNAPAQPATPPPEGGSGGSSGGASGGGAGEPNAPPPSAPDEPSEPAAPTPPPAPSEPEPESSKKPESSQKSEAGTTGEPRSRKDHR